MKALSRRDVKTVHGNANQVRSNRYPDWVMVGITSAMAVTAFLTYCTSDGQLKEMQSSSAETKQLVASANSQAKSTESLASAAQAQQGTMETSAQIANTQSKAIEDQASTARLQTEISRASLAIANISVNESRRLAVNAEKSYEIAQRSIELNSRALPIVEISIDKWDESKRSMTLSGNVRNYGKAPAYSLATMIQMISTDKNDIPPIIDSCTPKTCSYSDLAPDAFINLNFNLPPQFSEEQWSSLIDANTLIKIYVSMVYKDALDRSVKYTHCLQLNRATRKFLHCNGTGDPPQLNFTKLN